jgi:hypothetical protein
MPEDLWYIDGDQQLQQVESTDEERQEIIDTWAEVDKAINT